MPLLFEFLVLHLEFELGCSPLLVEVRGDSIHVESNSVARVLVQALLDGEELRVLNWELEIDVLGPYVHGERDGTRYLGLLEQIGLVLRVLSCDLGTITVG